MSKWILLIALALGGFLVWKFVPLNNFGPLSNKAQPLAAGADEFLEFIPSDTIFYSGGPYDQTLIKVASAYYSMPLAPTQVQQLESLASNTQSTEQPVLRLLKSFYKQFNAQSDLSMDEKRQAMGIAATGNYAIYAHGAVPVMRLSISDKSKMAAVFEKAFLDSGLTATQQMVGSADVRLLDITSDNEAVNAYLAVALYETNVTVTLFFDQDDDSVRKARLGQTPVTDSLAAVGEVSKLQNQYGLMDAGMTFLSIVEVVNGFLDFNANSFGKDLAKYLPDAVKANLADGVSPECRKDFGGLLAGMPRMIAGYTELGDEGDVLVSNGDFIWELANTAVKDELIKIRGHVPSHAMDSTDAIASAGTGLNMDALVPVLTSLWSRFTQAPYTCDTLVAAQAKAKQQNPAMLQMFLGMAQGVKGLGVSLYDIKMGPAMQPEYVSMLASIASDSPSALAAMTGMIPLPGLNGLVIPADGTPVDINLPMLPPAIKAKAAIKGKFIVLYAGAEGEQAAAALATEQLTANGLYGFGIDYRKFASIYDLIPTDMVSPMGAGTACVDQEEGRHVMSAIPMDFSFILDFDQAGMNLKAKVLVDDTDANPMAPRGAYTIEYLNEYCQWEAAGTETFNKDGSGSVSESSADGSCVILESTYKWRFDGSKFLMTEVTGRHRDDCSSEWQKNKNDTYSCRVLNITPESFQCLYDAGSEDARIYRYSQPAI